MKIKNVKELTPEHIGNIITFIVEEKKVKIKEPAFPGEYTGKLVSYAIFQNAVQQGTTENYYYEVSLEGLPLIKGSVGKTRNPSYY